MQNDILSHAQLCF